MSSKYALSVALLATLIGCSANTADKQHTPDTAVASVPKDVPVPPPADPNSKDTVHELPPPPMPDLPEPARPPTNWPEFDRLVDVMEKVVRNVYDRKGEVLDADVQSIEGGIRALVASAQGDKARRNDEQMATNALNDIRMIREHLPTGENVSPAARLELVRMPVTRLRDLMNGLEPAMVQQQLPRVEWMISKLGQAQVLAEREFTEREKQKQKEKEAKEKKP